MSVKGSMMKVPLVWGLLLAGALVARADVTLPAFFSDHMVLQQGVPVPVWGRAAPGETITATLDGREQKTIADAQGAWQVKFPQLKAGGPYVLTVTGPNTVTINDILGGEVWLASGQSNMQFALEHANNGAQEVAAADFPAIRMFTAAPAVAGTPQQDVKGSWQVCFPATAKSFSAVAYFFGRELHQQLKVPVGLINSSQGWTPAESWMSRRALESDPDFAYILQRWDGIVANYDRDQQAYLVKKADWDKVSAAAKAAGQDPPPVPKGPIDPNFIHRASGLWNGAIAPLIPFAIRGVIWYQGETNDQRGYQYRKLFPALITDWRRSWGQPDLPFLYVQLAAVLPPDAEPKESEWSEVREAQTMALRLPHTGMAVTIDIGEEKDVHPKNKQDVGHRLALWARSGVYGEKLVYSGPLYRSMKVEGDKIRLAFDHVDGGLITPHQEALKHFAIAGADHKFVWATATIDGESVVVSSPAVPQPVAVRYAWANNPVGCNLYNKAGLPASPFRTDDWPGKSFGNTRLTIDDF